jgi:hypothetical protein
LTLSSRSVRASKLPATADRLRKLLQNLACDRLDHRRVLITWLRGVRRPCDSKGERAENDGHENGSNQTHLVFLSSFTPGGRLDLAKTVRSLAARSRDALFRRIYAPDAGHVHALHRLRRHSRQTKQANYPDDQHRSESLQPSHSLLPLGVSPKSSDKSDTGSSHRSLSH